MLATSDLLTQLHGRKTPDRLALHYSLSHVLLAGRAYKRAVIDGISVDIRDMHSSNSPAASRATWALTASRSCTRTSCPIATTPLRPPADITQAVDVINALEQAHRDGRGTIMLNGRLSTIMSPPPSVCWRWWT